MFWHDSPELSPVSWDMCLHLLAGAQVLQSRPHIVGTIGFQFSRVASIQYKKNYTIWTNLLDTPICRRRKFPFGMSATYEVAHFEPGHVDPAPLGALRLTSSLM
jgi:hypothetical protein